MVMPRTRSYDIILLGATGYTGRLSAEHLAKTIPVKSTWAVAGRSGPKLQELASSLVAGRLAKAAPDILVLELNDAALHHLAKSTHILVNCIGPYHVYSSPVVKACAEGGTHYIDASGETPWIQDMMECHTTAARRTGAVMISGAGFESVPSDITSFVAASALFELTKRKTRNITCVMHQVRGGGMSGGSVASGITLLDDYPLQRIWQTLTKPWILTPEPHPKLQNRKNGVLARILGAFRHNDLGILTTSVSAPPNMAIVHRSAFLKANLFDYQFFSAEEFMRVPSYAVGIVLHVTIIIGLLLILPRISRRLIERFLPTPGDGPEEEEDDFVEWMAVASTGHGGPRALSRFRCNVGPYRMTGLLMAEAALTLLGMEDTILRDLGGGFITPACLGDAFVDRLRAASIEVDAHTIA